MIFFEVPSCSVIGDDSLISFHCHKGKKVGELFENEVCYPQAFSSPEKRLICFLPPK